MRCAFWICLLLVSLTSCLAKDEITNEVSPQPPPVNLDANLRRALLKALTELESEDNAKQANQPENIELGDKIVERASASSVSIFSHSISTTTEANEEENEDVSTETEKPYLLFQKSNSVQHQSITTIEHEDRDLDGFANAEEILTSASNSFTSPNKKLQGKSEQEKSVTNNINALPEESKATTKSLTVTTVAPIQPSTDESQAKVEDVQFFSAPLVAAFTVHQDEDGQPKKVEAIYKPIVNKKEAEEKLKLHQQQEHELELRQRKQQLELNTRLALQQKKLEEEILRLRQQDYLLRQQNYLDEQLRIRNKEKLFLEQQKINQKQHEDIGLTLQKEKLIQEQFRLRQNDQPFHPISTPLNHFQNKVKSAQVSLQPSISFDPALIEAGRLPANAQLLPVKNAVNFRSSVVQQTPQFQQQSLPFNNNFNQNFRAQNTVNNNFNQNFRQPLSNLHLKTTGFNVGLTGGSTRNLRQESGVGNFGTSFNNPQQDSGVTSFGGFNSQKESNIGSFGNSFNSQKNSGFGSFGGSFNNQKDLGVGSFRNGFTSQKDPGNTFSIQKSVDFRPFENNLNSNRFFRSNLEGTFTQPQNFGFPQQSNRFFRSNVEASPNRYSAYQTQPYQNYQLNNLLYNSGALAGKPREDISIISKVLSLNHFGDSRYAGSSVNELRVPYIKHY